MNWSLLVFMTKAQMRARYRRTFAGFVWVILSPIVLYAAQALAFKEILRIGIPNYGLFLLGGLLPWVFVVSSLEMGIAVPVGAREVFLALKVKPYLLVFSSLLDNAVNFVAAFSIILVPTVLITDVQKTGLWFLPLALLPLLAGTGGLLWFLSMLNVFYRDVRYVVHFMIGVLFFVTPIFYPKEFVPDQYQWLIGINPIYVLIEPVRICIYSFSSEGFIGSLAKATVCAALFGVAAVTYWKRMKNEFYHQL
ncbi:MAG: hypothetical protein A2X94_08035 [Bdellovibrionales bacterium GWB1_55_8]|nr:MAG: hypothetical protein A2X94_08035 [Bdellovibrionales bacterium GWB1_55_8]